MAKSTENAVENAANITGEKEQEIKDYHHYNAGKYI